MNLIPGCVYVSFHFHDGTLAASLPQVSSEYGVFFFSDCILLDWFIMGDEGLPYNRVL